MKVILLNCSKSFARRFKNSLGHSVYSSHPGLRITSSKIYQMQLMSYAGRPTFMGTLINRISDYTVETDYVTSHLRGVWVQSGLVHICRKSFRRRQKACSSGCPPSASTSR